MKIRVLMVLAALLVTTGCMSNDTIDDVDVNEDKLYGHYCVSYDENTKAVDVWAQLRAGGNTGTTVRLTGGHLSVDGDEMNERYGDEAFFNLHGTYYFLKRTSVAVQDSYAVNWDRSDGQRITNHISLPAPSRIVAPIEGEAVPTGSLTVVFDGPPPTGREVIEVRLRGHGPHRHGPIRQLEKRVTSGNEVMFSALEMLHFHPRSRITIELKRKARGRPEQGHSAEGGLVETEYTAERVSVELTRDCEDCADR